MKKGNLFLCAALLCAFSAAAFAVEVNEGELETVSVDAVVFENYTGPHSVINTAQEISSIGSGLGSTIASNLESQARAGNEVRYQVIHAIDPSESGKLDADIFIIGSNATVDHIRNVRRIISAYLVSAYNYSERDADTLAVFVTVYNAVYRGNMDYFSSKYKKVVTDSLTQDKAGIALNYQDWPGKTQIVIPLNDINGGLSTVDTSVISDRQVVQSMQDEDDKSVDARKEMVDIKERESDIASEKAQEAQKQATVEQEKLRSEQQKEQQAIREAQQAQKEAEEAQKAAEENPENEQLQAEAEEKQAAAEEKQAAAEEQTQVREEQQQRTEQAQQEAQQAQAVADTKRTEAQTERTSIAQDQQTIIREQTANERAVQVVGLKAVDELGVLSSIVKMNAETGRIIKESPVNVIRSRTMYEESDFFVAIAGTNINNGAVKLVQIDKENMEIIKEGTDIIAENSVLVQDEGNYYCVVQNGSSWIIGKFNSNLESLLKSTATVKAATPITVTSAGLLVTSSSNTPILLEKSDLSVISTNAQNVYNYSDAK